MSPLSRRAALRLGAAAAASACLGARDIFAFGDASKVDCVEINMPGGSISRPEAWSRLLFEIEQTTSIETVSRVPRIAPEDPALFEHPFAALVGDGELKPLSDAAIEQLRRYLTYGGFLLIDDATGLKRSAFDDSVRKLIGRLFPTRSLFPLPSDHAIFRSFFLINRPVGRVALFDHVEAVSLGEITPLVYFRNDLSGALSRGADGRGTYPCTPGGENQRREAVKLAVNLVMYALTSNYKQDQAHVAELMKEGRL